MKETRKYEYFIHTWGGFYNQSNVDIHGFTKEQGGSKWFDTKEDRENYINLLENVCKNLGTPDACIVHVIDEGYDTRDVPTAHRITEYEGKHYYSCDKWNWPSDLSTIEYHMEWKWYPGFNDYPLGMDFDYSKVNIVQEWITGVRNREYEQEL